MTLAGSTHNSRVFALVTCITGLTFGGAFAHAGDSSWHISFKMMFSEVVTV